MVVGDLRLRGADNAYQRGFPDVRKSDKTDVREQLQLKNDVELLPRETGLREARYLPSRGREVDIALSSLSAARDNNRLVVGDIRHYPAGVRVLDDGAARNAYHRRLHRLARAALCTARLAVGGDVFLLITEIYQRGEVIVRDKDDIGALSAVAAVGSARVYIFFPVEGNSSVAAVSRLDGDLDLVYKHCVPRLS